MPFLQRVNPDAKILPIVMGDQRSKLCSILAELLTDVLSPDGVVFVASSDLSHFHDQRSAQRLDGVAATDILAALPTKLLDDIEQNRCEACGGGPIAVVLAACMHFGAEKVSILRQCTSGDVSGDHARVVGYLSAAISAGTAGRR